MRRAARILIAVTVFAVGCREDAGNARDSLAGRGSSAAVAAASSNRTAGVVFDPTIIGVGDTTGTVVVERVAITRSSDSLPIGSVHFGGSVKLVGQVIPHPDPEYASVCFEVDALSASSLPRWKGDARRMWFCFTNIAEASQQVMPYLPGQKYEILIDQYTVHSGTSDEVNAARLVKVLGRLN